MRYRLRGMAGYVYLRLGYVGFSKDKVRRFGHGKARQSEVR